MIEVRALVAGKVIDVLVQPGAAVAEDDDLLLIESMKMEIPISAPASGAIHEVHVGLGQAVQANDLLVTIV